MCYWRVYDVVCEVCMLPLNNFCPSDGMSQVQFLEVMCLYKEATGFLVKKLLVPCELYFCLRLYVVLLEI